MAMVKCKECGADVSSKAKVCPHCGVEAPWVEPTAAQPQLTLTNVLIVFGLLFAFIGWLASSGEDDARESHTSVSAKPKKAKSEPTLAEQYPGPWNNEISIPISQTLVANKIRGCGLYKHKASIEESNQYIVYCSRDGNQWQAYIVWTAIERVMGPYPPDPSLQ